MDAHIVLEEWEKGPFDGGFDRIRELRSQRFSGAVETGGTVLFLREGEPIAVVAGLEDDPRPGDVDAFEGAAGQRREAPFPAVATVAAMLALDGDVRGRYFTDDTPLSTVHGTLTEGGFTGYVELSENVMSGDYYVVYVDGEADHVGFVGGSNELITGEEARERAEDEVGIYRVVAVELPSVELPESAGGSEAAEPVAGGVDLDGADDGAADGDEIDPAVTDADPPEDTAVPNTVDAGKPGSDADPGERTASSPQSSEEPGLAPGSGPEPGESSRSDFEINLDLGPESDAEANDDAESAPASEPEPEPAAAPESDSSPDPDPGPPSTRDTGPASESESESGSQSAADSAEEPVSVPDPDSVDDRASDSGSGSDPGSASVSEGDSEGDAEADSGSTSSSETASGPDSTPSGDDLDIDLNLDDDDSDRRADESTTQESGSTGGPGGAGESGGSARRRDGSSERATLEDVTTRMVPSLDPAKSSRTRLEAGGGQTSGQKMAQGGRKPRGRARSEATSADDAGSGSASDAGSPPRSSSGSGSREGSKRRIVDVKAEYERRVERIREEYEGRIEELRSELEEHQDERERLQQRISTLEAQSGTDAGVSGGTTDDGQQLSLSPSEAFAGTSLFVRETTRGEATLEDAHEGRVDRQTLVENLRLEYHTTFEDEGATVDGEPFEAWLRSSPPYEFAEWLVSELLFEIRSTNAAGAMQHLYDALPQVDRIAFADEVTVEDGDESREMVFDVVVRDQMGDPLAVVTIDESRDPTRADTIEPLIIDASDVCETSGTLAAAFAVTSSYFEPESLDVAREATSGSLLSREKFRSYVKLTRKNGYHLCLVESRADSFHLAMPEL